MKGEKTRTILYFHGFLSVGNGQKPRSIREAMPDAGVLSPDLVFDPLVNRSIIAGLVQSLDRGSLIFVGTSLGGFWAHHAAQSYGCPCILVNPCVSPSRTFRDRCGVYQNLETGDPVSVTPEDLAHYALLEDELRTGYTGEGVHLLVARDDEVLPCQNAVEYFTPCQSLAVTETGGHRFASEWHRVIAMLQTFPQGELLCRPSITGEGS